MEECVREEISVRYLTVNSMLYTFIFIFVGLLLKTDFSDQVWEFKRTLYQLKL